MNQLMIATFLVTMLSACSSSVAMRPQSAVNADSDARIRRTNPHMRGEESAIARKLRTLMGGDPVGLSGDCPPQGVAMLDRPIHGCADGMILVMLKNPTQLTMTVEIDGEMLTVNGETVYEGIPPRSNAWVLLEEPGIHSISGEAYLLRGQRWVPAGDFDTHATWNFPRGADNFHVFYLDQSLLQRH